jgi:hypothetical protein
MATTAIMRDRLAQKYFWMLPADASGGWPGAPPAPGSAGVIYETIFN